MKLNGHFRARKKDGTAKKATAPRKKKITIPKPVEPTPIPLAPPGDDPNADTYA